MDNGSILHYSWYEQMHTRIDILLYGEDAEELTQLSIRIYELIRKFDRIADRFNPDSEISKVNRCSYNGSVPVSDYLFDMLSECTDAHKKTQGLFDITINSSNHNLGSIKTISLNPEARTIQISDSETILDINGYVKGYTIDRIKDLILSTSIKNVLVNLGNSSILALGHHPFGDGWKIKGLTASIADITLHNECLTTSGNIVAERKHIKNPLSHNFISGEQTISLVTPSGSVGEVLSTSLLLADRRQRAEILEQFMLSEERIMV